MGDFSGNIDMEKLMSYSDDLVAVLKENRDINNLKQCFEQSNALKNSCRAESNEVRGLLEDYGNKIDECKKKTEKAKSEVVTDAEMDLLRKELDKEIENESKLMEELRVIDMEIADLDCQRVSVEEQKQLLRKREQEQLKAQRTLSMYASVTNIIPNMDDPSKISGYIVDRDKKVVEKFEFDWTKISPFDTCQSIWKMISLRDAGSKLVSEDAH